MRSERMHRGRTVASALVALAVLAVLVPAVAQARWTGAFDLAGPGALDVASPQLALAPSGAAAAAFGTYDVDTPGTAQAYLTLRSAQGTVGRPLAIAGAADVLDATYDHGTLQLLTGTAASGQTCCVAARALTVGAAGQASPAQTLVSGLAGPVLGRLVPLADGHTVAAVATERGVWVIQSRGRGRWGSQHLLTGGGKMPEMLSAARVGANGTALAWTAPAGIAGDVDPRTISVATATGGAAPRRVSTAVTVAAGHRIEELAVAARGSTVTLAWIESWYDHGGAYHAVVRAIDLARGAGARTLSPAGATASGLQLGGDPAGDQTIVWQSCSAVNACSVRSDARTARGTFGAARPLGGSDPDQAPALAVSPAGAAVAGWVSGGHPMAAARSGPGGGFGAATRLSPTVYAYDVTVAIGSGRRALAAWTQGTLNPSVVAAAGF